MSSSRKPKPLTFKQFAAQVGGFPTSALASASPPAVPTDASTRAARLLVGDLPSTDRDRVRRVAAQLDRLVEATSVGASPKKRARGA